jgi:hypothetical protein
MVEQQIKGDLERISEEEIMTLSRYCPGIYLEGLRKIQ